MEAQRVTILEAKDQPIAIRSVDSVPTAPTGAVKKTFLEWELEDKNLFPRSRNWPKKPYKRTKVQGKVTEMLSVMKIDYTSSIVVVEDAFGINDLNWNSTPRRRRARQNEAQRLAAQFTFIHLLLAPPRLPRVEPLSINHEDLLVEHQGN
ncbi:hypothetical protein AMTR_s00164p00060110 [Amborella trichopoda]|uniref:Uncharacterized protein n=1 Tax=Amborella trichopoda TaxID=13333 RepID=W1PSA2_AMBTC|nr:hypothetical protein AMTR_s00164p00060110 [Amborella trichopoda]